MRHSVSAFALTFLLSSLALCEDAKRETSGGQSTAESSSPRPFFAFQNGVRLSSTSDRIALLKKLGYDGIGSAYPTGLAERLPLYDEAGLKIFSPYLGLEAHADRYVIKPGVAEAIAELKGRGKTTVIELFVQGARNHPGVREQAIAGVREVAKLAEQSGLRVVLYPHAGFHVDTVGKAFEVAQATECANVGVMFNLCHFLKVEPESDLRETLVEVAPLLWRVSTSGADAGGSDWGELIQPLDSGTFSQAGFFALLEEVGYEGPIGLQCFGIKVPSGEHLERSMMSWRQLRPN